MRSDLVIIVGIFRKDSPKVIRVECDQMISALAQDRPDQAFSISVLPGRAERGGPVPDAHGSHPSLERAAKCSVIVTDEILGRCVPRECFGDLARQPLRRKSDSETWATAPSCSPYGGNSFARKTSAGHWSDSFRTRPAGSMVKTTRPGTCRQRSGRQVHSDPHCFTKHHGRC